MNSISALVDSFIPDQLADQETLESRRADIVVKTAFIIVGFCPPFGLMYYLLLDSVEAATGVVVALALTMLAPIVLRKTGDTRLAGHLLLAPIYAVLLWIAYFTGGLFAPGLACLVLMPIMAILIFGKRMAAVWMGIIVVTYIGAFGLLISGVDLGQDVYAEYDDKLRLFELLMVGSLVFALIFVKDGLEGWLTDQVRQKERKTRAVLQTAPDGIVTVDVEGTIQSANDAALELFDCSRQQLEGRPIRDLIVDLDVDELRNQNGELDSSRELEGRRNETSFPLELAIGLLGRMSDEDEEGVVLVMRDITQRKEAQQQLREARDEALEASQAKSTFLANMSHELRTPLNAVIGYSEMMLEEVAFLQDTDEDVPDAVVGFRPDLKRIHNAGNHLLDLINDILDLSKIEAGKMQTHIETFDVDELIDNIAGTVRPLAQENDNEFRTDVVDELPVMNSDITKVRQILFNLLSNACKFTNGGQVSLSVDYDDADELFVFVVEDDGIGMDDDEIEQVFEAFSQADTSTTREFGGTGLGLTITSHFCSLLGGSIEVQSRPGEGTTFTVRLAGDLRPQTDEQVGATGLDENSDVPVVASGAGAVDEIDGDAETVLVVDDDATVRDLMTRMLSDAGFEVFTAASGSEGMLIARQLNPSVITLDVMMPSMDGWTMLTKLKEDPELCDIPVVMVSMLSEQGRGYALGADDYLVKPIDKQKLVSVLDDYRRPEPTSGNILVVEDDEPTRSLIRRVLEKDDWTVAEAENGKEGLDAAEHVDPDLILLDLMMPEVDGFQFLHQFRSDDSRRQVPIIVVTAKELSEDERQQLETNVEDILAKGGRDRAELLDDVRRMVTELVKPGASSSTVE